MLIRLTAGILCAIVLNTASHAFAIERHTMYKERTPSPLSFFVGERTWLSTGDNEWSIAGTTSGGPPNILSELEFLDIDSTVVEIFGGIRSGAGALTLRYGFGSMENGIYRDSDYRLDDRQGIFSLSTGKADGDDWNDLYYFTIDYSYRFLSRKTEEGITTRYLDFIIGYQRWHEDMTITNGLQVICSLPCTGGTGPFAGLNSHYFVDWKSLLIGLEGALPLYRGFTLKGTTVFIPYTRYRGEGIWNLRTDFKQNPSFTHEADGGYGVEIDASLGYRIQEKLEIEAGYRYWFIKSYEGTDTTFFSSGAIGITQFNEAVSERQGAFLEFTYLF
ncbi:MAG: hypothetical protein GY721_05160 [Deltaproteobacteria bacterium]|nr:hypothetical protein [Deltaproteobacteria bacterium]